MSQSKRGSRIETGCNYTIGLFLSTCVWYVIVMPLSYFMGWDFHHERELARVMTVNVIFTVTSIARSYGVRRLFVWFWHKGWVR